MNSLFDDGAADGFRERVRALTADSAPQWGKMDVAQACAHMAAALEAATGVRPLKRSLLAKMLGWMFRGLMVGPKPFSRNAPTHPDLVVADEAEFTAERDRLLAAIDRFMELGPDGVAGHEHALVGSMTGDEWGRTQHKHLVHHLEQFGV